MRHPASTGRLDLPDQDPGQAYIESLIHALAGSASALPLKAIRL
jgi:hypothetical protein